MNKFLFCFLCFLFVACSTENEKAGVLTHYLPEESSLIIRSESFSTLQSDLKNSSFFSVFSELDIHTFFSEKLEFSNYLNPTSEVLLSTTSENDSLHHITLITRQHPNLFLPDSIPEKTIETLSYQDQSFQKLTLNEQLVYTTIVDSVFIASSSQKIVASILLKQKNKNLKSINTDFENAYSTLGKQNVSFMINAKGFHENLQQLLPDIEKFPPFASWISLDAEMQPSHLKLNGIAIAQDTIPQLMNVFKGTKPQKNLLAAVTPSSASSIVSYTYDDFDVLQNNLKTFKDTNSLTTSHQALFASLNEIGIIAKEKESIIGLHAISGAITAELLAPILNDHSEFRGLAIKKLSDSAIFKDGFNPLVTATPKYGVQLEDFFVFAESTSTIEEIITDFLNETTVSHLPYYEEHMAHLSSESSLLLVGLLPNIKKPIANKTTTKNQQQISGLKFGNHRMAALQFVYDTHFSHVNGIVRETQTQNRGSGVSQVFAIQLENELLSRPQLFTNHISKGKNIVVQDVANKLYFIGSNGRVQWNKQLDGAIIGEVQEVDLLRNGRIQLAFTTKNTFYILDRNGKEVSPFPLKFKGDITLPLAVFDYENNRNYRFVITQGDEVYMYDNKGKSVSGFTFKKAGSSIVLPPKHIRILNKDYILIAEESGKLNILHRTGKNRINVSNKFNFGESQLYSEDNKFVFLTAEDQKISIDPNGKVNTQNLNSNSKNVVWEILGNTKTTLDDNILRINNQKIELPYGLYTTPKISISNRRILISITDLQQQRTYVYNSLGELLSNFPVYGTSVMDMGDATNNGRPNGVVKGASKEVVLYEIN